MDERLASSFVTYVLFHGALLGCKLGRLWRMPCSKGAKLQRAHGLAMHHAIMPSHEELWTSAPCRGRGEDAGGWLRTRRKGPPASLNIILEFDSRSTKHLVLETCGGGMGTPAPPQNAHCVHGRQTAYIICIYSLKPPKMTISNFDLPSHKLVPTCFLHTPSAPKCKKSLKWA